MNNSSDVEMIAKLNNAFGKALIDDLKFKIGPL